MPKLQANGIELHYEATGEGQPVLFIHGLGSSCRDWEMQMPVFSKQYRVVSFDLRGHGQSQKPPGPYSMSLFAKDTAELTRSLGIAPVHVVGISLGGMIAFQLGVDHPELVKSLVIVNAGPEVVIRTMKDRWNVFLRFATVRLLGMRKMGEVLGRRLFPREEQADIQKLFVERWAENDTRAYLDTLRAIVGWSVTDRIQNINLPTLVVAADGDYTPVSAKQAFVSKMPQVELVVIPDSRHATPVDSPEKFNEAVMSFLSKR
jgi:pimeloyl-ACP methyl ester carboxylesterase